MAEVQLSGVGKLFDGVRVLESLDLTVDDGEFVVLLGPALIQFMRAIKGVGS